MAAIALGPVTAAAASGKRPHKKGTKVRPTPASRLEIDLIVVARDRRSSSLHVLVASSRGFARRNLLRVQADGVLAQIGGGPGMQLAAGPVATPRNEMVARPPEPARPAVPDAPVELGTPHDTVVWGARRALGGWRGARPGAAEFALAAALDHGDQAGFRGTECSDCVLVQRKGVVVIARGLSKQTVATISSDIAAGGADLRTTLLDMSHELRRRWPGRAVVRSAAYYLLPGDDHSREELVVDVHAGGRANEQLRRLHVWHLAEVEGHDALVRARQAAAQGDDRRRGVQARYAIEALRIALRA